MDPFTFALRSLIGKKVFDSVKTAYKETKDGLDSMISKWNTSLREEKARQQETKRNTKKSDPTETLFGEKSIIETSPITTQGKAATTSTADEGTITDSSEKVEITNPGSTDSYKTIVKMAQDAGYTPSDAEVVTILEDIKNRNILKRDGVTGELLDKNNAKTVEDDSDVVTYTYKPGDTFGQVLLDLGLSDGRSLWGSGGDVEFYTQQLAEQGMLDQNGNVKIGVPFKLRRRK